MRTSGRPCSNAGSRRHGASSRTPRHSGNEPIRQLRGNPEACTWGARLITSDTPHIGAASVDNFFFVAEAGATADALHRTWQPRRRRRLWLRARRADARQKSVCPARKKQGPRSLGRCDSPTTISAQSSRGWRYRGTPLDCGRTTRVDESHRGSAALHSHQAPGIVVGRITNSSDQSGSRQCHGRCR